MAAGDIEGSVALAGRALDLVDADDHIGRGSAAGFLGLANWTYGDLEAAAASWTDALNSLLEAGYASDAAGCTIAVADIRTAQGRLRDAIAACERALAHVERPGDPAQRGSADMHVALAEIFRERNDLATAKRHLRSSEELGEAAGLAQNAYRRRVALARVREAEGDLDAAVDLLDDAERRYASDYFPNVRPIPAMRARLWIAQGRLDVAASWAREHRVSIDDDLAYVREFDHITLARLLARSGQDGDRRAMSEGAALLDGLLEAAEAGQRDRSVIEIRVLQALQRQARRDIAGAIGHLRPALTLAEPEGFVRIFVDEGAPMQALLESAARLGSDSGYVRRLLDAFRPARAAGQANRALVEPLSEREIEVLRLLATDLDGPAIARELVVSLHTVRSHTKRIYAKLGVNDRRAAVRRATELDLLPRASGR
jgi:LuxR family maltose regulon positive regulatory protein